MIEALVFVFVILPLVLAILYGLGQLFMAFFGPPFWWVFDRIFPFDEGKDKFLAEQRALTAAAEAERKRREEKERAEIDAIVAAVNRKEIFS